LGRNLHRFLPVDSDPGPSVPANLELAIRHACRPAAISRGKSKQNALVKIAGAVLILASACGGIAAPLADAVFLHGSIHTEDADRRVVQALALRGNTIVALGTDEEIKRYVGEGTHVVDLDGHTVLPGLIDAHIHPAESSLDLGKCNVHDQLMSVAQLKAAIKSCLEAKPGDRERWFEVVEINSTGLALSLADLDSMLRDRPLLLMDSAGHTAWANSAALKAASITAQTKDPAGGIIERDAQAHPTGTLRDEAFYLVQRARPAASLAFETAQLERALAMMRADGITSVQDAMVNEHFMRLYKNLYDAHRLDMRVRASFGLSPGLRDPTLSAGELIRQASAFRDKWAVDPDFLRADAVKIFADGVIEYPAQTASLLMPYLNADGHPSTNRGPTYLTQDKLNAVIAAADAAGFTVHVHAIGDRAVRSTLDAFAYSRARQHATDNRDQIAHLELVDPADFARFAQLDVIANFQFLWFERDPYIETGTIAYLGPERSQHLYPARSLLDAGARIAAGSDWSVSSFNPFEAIERAVTRASEKGAAPLLIEQAIPLAVAVDAYTINAAYALHQERTTGSLEPGKRGDFVVLDRDIFVIDPFQIHDTKVLATYLDGREVYASHAH